MCTSHAKAGKHGNEAIGSKVRSIKGQLVEG